MFQIFYRVANFFGMIGKKYMQFTFLAKNITSRWQIGDMCDVCVRAWVPIIDATDHRYKVAIV